MTPKMHFTAALFALVVAACGDSGSTPSNPAQVLPEIFVANESEALQVVTVDFEHGFKHLTIGGEDTFEFTFEGTDFTRAAWSATDTYEIAATALGSDAIVCSASLEVSNEARGCVVTVADDSGCIVETRVEDGDCEVSLLLS